VTSIDGVAAIEAGRAPSGGIISGRNEADRFVMGLLRAFADAILVGAGTVRAEGGRALWTPEYIFPAMTDSYRALRRSLGRSESPQLVIVTGRGDLSPTDQAIQAGALVLTSRASEATLRDRLPSTSQVKAISDDGSLHIRDVLRAIRDEGHQVILTEGGPHLFGQLVAASAVDELFLTLSPSLAGRADNGSLGLIQGVDFGRSLKWAKLESLRQSESHLFLRYRLERAA
jgi:riboflavin biosynthesis pyrimidine reductase